MKEYKVKEHLLNLKQSVDSLKQKFEDMTDKFDILVEELSEKEGRLSDIQTWACPKCGSEDNWFDRTIEYGSDGEEKSMVTRCSGCGKDCNELMGSDSNV